MKGIVKNLHLFLAIYLLFEFYTIYRSFQQEKDDLFNQIPMTKRNIRKVKKQSESLKTYFKDVEEAKRRIKTVTDGIERTQKQFPDKISDTENLEILRGYAARLNIKNIFLSPGEEKNFGFYISKEYTLRAVGTFLQFLIFLEKVEGGDRLFNIDNFQLTKTKDKQKGRFQLVNGSIVLTAYRHNPNHKEETGIEKIESDFKNGTRKKKKNKNKKKKEKKRK